MSDGQTIIVSSRKYDQVEHRRWPAKVAVYQPPLVVLDAQFTEEVQHDLLGIIREGTISTEYYWLDRWYNIFRFGDAEGPHTFYCNVASPPLFNGEILSYIDLDIDVFVKADKTYQVLDLDDFERNADLYNYSEEARSLAESALDELINLIQSRSFPFNE